MEPNILIQNLLKEVCDRRITDLYFLPINHHYRILIHQNGEVTERQRLPFELGKKVIAYLKYQANMAVSEHRRPQAGAWHWQNGSQKINLRLSTVGDFKSQESLVMRLIYPLLHYEYRMLDQAQWLVLKDLMLKQGLILFAGPMGSGKTTTMYRLLKECCANQVVLTIEDPVEIEEGHFIQLQVNDIAGMSYHELLKLGLRHRPQVLIIGEIREPLTAQIAIEAALSGHLVLATIHAKSATGVIARLEQLGISDYYIDQALCGACYQRLIPLKDKDRSAVLFDIQNHDELMRGKGSAISGKWQQLLQQAWEQQEITTPVKKLFWQG